MHNHQYLDQYLVIIKGVLCQLPVQITIVMCYLSIFLNIGAIDKTEKNKQVLDKLQVERERGITVKAQTASLFYSHHGQQFLLNLIDTPVRTWFLSVFTVCFFLVFAISLPCATCLTVV